MNNYPVLHLKLFYRNDAKFFRKSRKEKRSNTKVIYISFQNLVLQTCYLLGIVSAETWRLFLLLQIKLRRKSTFFCKQCEYLPHCLRPKFLLLRKEKVASIGTSTLHCARHELPMDDG